MANLQHAKKAIRSQHRKFIKNLRRKRAYRDASKEALKAAEAGDTKASQTALQTYYKAIDKAAKHNGPLHQKTAARYKSRLTKRVNSMLSE